MIHLIILAILQGITEFLPISSSAHLRIYGILTNFNQPEVIDIAAHMGTFFAVVIYYIKDISLLVKSTINRLFGKIDNQWYFAYQLIIASIPTIMIGFIIEVSFEDSWKDSLILIAITSIVFGLILGIVDIVTKNNKSMDDLPVSKVLFIGFMQALAFIPGVSRSGIVLTATRILGIERMEAAKFTILLSLPVILAAGSKKAIDVGIAQNSAMWFDILIVATISCLSALIVIALFIKWLRNYNLMPFVIYRVALGAFLILLFLN